MVIVTFALIVPALSILVPIAAIWDLVRGRNLPTVRMLVFGTIYLGWEVIAAGASGLLWVASLGGRFIDRPWSQHAHLRLQAMWVRSLLSVAQRVLRLRVIVRGIEALDGGPMALLSRHASMVDTLIPAKLLFDSGRSVRYVLKDDLLWDPALDLVGHRLPNYFVDRSGSNTPAELAAIGELSATAAPNEAVVIFPEGTRWSPRKYESAMAKLSERDPVRAARFTDRTNTLPPRPNGTIAVLRGAPGVDPVFMAHTGLEGLAGPTDALRLVPFRHPVVVELWRVPRSELPEDHDGLAVWLDHQWERMDDWVAEHRVT